MPASKAASGRGRPRSSARMAANAGSDAAPPAGSPEIRMLRLSQISAPKYDFTIHRQSSAERLRERLEAGSQIPPVMVAQLGDRYYPFASFASLDAHKALAMDVPCQVHVVSSQLDILELHVAREQKETMHPMRFLEGVRELHDHNADMTVVPEEYRAFGSRPILLASTAGKMLDTFLVEVGERYDLVGEWTHVIETISKLKKGAQDRAVSEIISYVKTQKRPIPPDMYSLRKILDAYSADRLEKIYADDDGYDAGEDYDDDDDGAAGGGGGSGRGRGGGQGKPGKPGGKKAGGKNKAGDIAEAESVIVSSTSKGEMPLVMSPVPSSLTHTCHCGQEFLLSTKNATVRKLRPTEDNVMVLDSDEGRPIYAVPRDGVEFLELELSPSLRFYYVGGEKTEDGDRGHTMIMSKRSISKANLAAIRRIIEGTGGSGNGKGGGSRSRPGSRKR